jgi:hypothetical protein
MSRTGCCTLALTLTLIEAIACSRTAPSATGTESGSTATSSSTGTSDTSESGRASTTTETDTDGTTDDGLTFVPIGEYGDESCSCDPFQQDCPDGEKCAPSAKQGGEIDCVSCVDVLGEGEPGDACVYGGTFEATDDCGPTSSCFNVMDVDGQSVGVCAQFCEGTADDPICPMGTDCLIANEGSINLCVVTCNPLLQDCGLGLGCFFNDGFFCVVPAQNLELGQPCEDYDDCAPGLVCLDESVLPSCAGASCCASHCSVMDGVPCPEPGTECAPFFEQDMAPVGYEDVGVCVVS